MKLSSIDRKILNLLKTSKIPLSTYQIAKKVKITWVTANSHCYKLKSMNLIQSKYEKSKHGSRGKIVWWIEK
jgi:predicted ArsR family transcriptional regulator